MTDRPGGYVTDEDGTFSVLTKTQLSRFIWEMKYWTGYFHGLHIAKWEAATGKTWGE